MRRAASSLSARPCPQPRAVQVEPSIKYVRVASLTPAAAAGLGVDACLRATAGKLWLFLPPSLSPSCNFVVAIDDENGHNYFPRGGATIWGRKCGTRVVSVHRSEEVG